MIDPREAFTAGVESLRHHALRSLLAMLGIIFGVAAVIAMLSIGEGAKRAALEKFEALGVNNIIIRDKELSDKDLEEARAKFSKGLSTKDAEAIEKIVPTVVAVSAQAELEVEAARADRTETSRPSVEATMTGTGATGWRTAPCYAAGAPSAPSVPAMSPDFSMDPRPSTKARRAPSRQPPAPRNPARKTRAGSQADQWRDLHLRPFYAK